MKTQELLDLGLNRKQVNEIFAMNGKDIERVKAECLRQEQEIAELKNGLEEREKELAKYREVSIEDLKTEAKTWKEKAEQAEKEGQEERELLRVQEELQRLCEESGAKDAKLVEALIDRASVGVTDGEVYGLAEQVESLKTNYSFLFQEKELLPYFSQGSNKFEEEENNVLRKAIGL